MTGFAAAKGTFVTDRHIELLSISELGFRPCAVIAWWSRQGPHGIARGNRGGMGLWTAEGSASVAWSSADGEPSTRAGHIADAAAILGLDDPGGDVAMRADVQSCDADGLTLRWTRPPPEQWIVHFLALGGTSVAARVGWVTSGTLDSGGRPDLLLLVPAPPETTAPAQDLTIGVGAASARSQAAAAYSCRSGAPPGAVIAAQRSDTAVVALDEPVARRLCYLAVEGPRVRVGTDVSTAGPGRKRTRVGFRPEALLLFSWGLAPSRRPRAIGRLCVGAAAGPVMGCASWDDRNVEADETCTHVASSIEDVLLVTDTRSGGIHAQAQVASIDDRGFTLDWQRSDAGPRQFAYVALGARRS